MIWQFYPKLHLLPWHSKHLEQMPGFKDHYLHYGGWLFWQFQWRSSR